MNTTLISIITLLAGIGAGLIFKKIMKRQKYFEAVRQILRDNECPMFHYDTIKWCYERGEPAWVAADTIMTRFEQWCGGKTTRTHKRRFTDKKANEHE